MATTSKNLYPFNIKELAVRLGVTPSAVYQKLKNIEVSQFDTTYIGSEKRFTVAVLEQLKQLPTRSSPTAPKHKTFSTPYGETSLEDSIPLPSPSSIERYPFSDMKVGQSFALPSDNKNAFEKVITESNKRFSPAKFTRRYYADLKQVRIWRVE